MSARDICPKCGSMYSLHGNPSDKPQSAGQRELDEFALEQFGTYWLGSAAWAPEGRLVAYTEKPTFCPSIPVVERKFYDDAKAQLAALEGRLKDAQDDWKRIQDAERKCERLEKELAEANTACSAAMASSSRLGDEVTKLKAGLNSALTQRRLDCASVHEQDEEIIKRLEKDNANLRDGILPEDMRAKFKERDAWRAMAEQVGRGAFAKGHVV